MDDVTQGIYDLQAGSSILVAGLSTYGGSSCIFTGEIVPPRAPRPYTWSYGNLADIEFESKDLRGRDVMRDIWVVCDASGSADEVEYLGRVVRDLFHRATINIGSAFTNYITRASGPIKGPTDDPQGGVTTRTIVSRIVTVRIMYQG